jgi:hypothetical protein
MAEQGEDGGGVEGVAPEWPEHEAAAADVVPESGGAVAVVAGEA